jgi:hypothetical protein
MNLAWGAAAENKGVVSYNGRAPDVMIMLLESLKETAFSSRHAGVKRTCPTLQFVAAPGRSGNDAGRFSFYLCIAKRQRKVSAENPDLWTAHVPAYKVNVEHVHQ